MTKTMNIALSALVPLALAGTCLAAPAAMAVPATQVETGVAAQAAEEGVVVTKGHLQVTVPADYTIEEDGEGFSVMASNADGTVVAYLADTAVPNMPTDPTQLQATFDEVSEAALGENGAAVVDKTIGELSDGTEVYVYLYSVTIAGTEYGAYLVFLPYEGGFSFAQLAAPVDVAGEELAQFEQIVDSLLPAAAPIEVPEGYVVGQSDGFAFAVPADLVDNEDGSWSDADETFMLGSMGLLTEEFSTLTDDEINQLIDMMAEELEAEVTDIITLDGNGISFTAVGYYATDPELGGGYSVILGLVPNKNDELIGLVALCMDGTAYPDAQTVAETFFTSVTQL